VRIVRDSLRMFAEVVSLRTRVTRGRRQVAAAKVSH
jgi:hypothetical protein